MTDTCRRQPAIDMPLHPRPGQRTALAPTWKPAEPQSSDLTTEGAQRRGIHRLAVIANVPPDHTAQPRALLADGPVHASPQSGFHLLQRPPQPFANRLLQHGETSVAPLLHADVRPTGPTPTGDSGISVPAHGVPERAQGL
jgi:hypothetical protein